jgi:hypothetical protein
MVVEKHRCCTFLAMESTIKPTSINKTEKQNGHGSVCSCFLVGIFNNKANAAECSMWNVISSWLFIKGACLVNTSNKTHYRVSRNNHPCPLDIFIEGSDSKLSTVLVLVGCPYCTASLL